MKSRGKMMKRLKFPKRIIALLCGVTLCIGGLVTAYAGSDDPMPFDPDPNPDPVVTEQVVTDPPIQTDPPIETIPIQTTVPVTEPIVTDPPTTVPVTETPTTLPQVQTEPVTEGGGGIIDDHPDTTEFVPPTIPKTAAPLWITLPNARTPPRRWRPLTALFKSPRNTPGRTGIRW